MSENTYKPRNYRIIRHVTKSRILDIQDALEIDKLRIELVEFAEGAGATLSVEHFAEPDALALVFYDILQGRPWEKYIEYKGTVQGEAVISRVLVVERVEARNPIKITVSRGPGKVGDKGAIQPLGKPEASLSVLLSEFDARRIALTVLRHMAAYEAATYHARVAANTWPAAEAGATDADGPLAEPEAAASPQASVAAGPAHRPPARAGAPEPLTARMPAAEPQPAVPAAPAPMGAPQATPAAQPAPTPRRTAPAVETYWMAAERLGVSRAEAERILQEAKGDWGQAWNALRQRELA